MNQPALMPRMAAAAIPILSPALSPLLITPGAGVGVAGVDVVNPGTGVVTELG